MIPPPPWKPPIFLLFKGGKITVARDFVLILVLQKFELLEKLKNSPQLEPQYTRTINLIKLVHAIRVYNTVRSSFHNPISWTQGT